MDASQQINVLLYHGKNKDLITSPQRLAAYSVVITSYTLVANDCRSIVTKLAKGDVEHPIDLLSDEEDIDEDVGPHPSLSKQYFKMKYSVRWMLLPST